jgi:hypothetical protein
VINQTLTLLVDAYRELNAKKLFWIVLFLSTFIAASFSILGISARGLTIFAWEFEFPGVSTDTMSPGTFYKLLFSQLGFKMWLTWAASILALVSTASIIPDFVRGGAIEVALSKPIGRVRLFLTKYCTGLLFVALQVALFSLAAFLVIGIRGRVWEPAVFLSIPLVVLFFSYLYCFCALIGLLTRSSMTAMLLTVVFWFVLFIVGSAERMFLLFDISTHRSFSAVEARLETRRVQLEALEARENPTPQDLARLERIRGQVESDEAEHERLRVAADRWRMVHSISFGLKTVLPKTGETMDLFERWLVDWGELEPLRQQSLQASNGDEGFGSPEDTYELERVLRSRSPLWVLGTSLAFEGAVVALACGYFARRDF